MDVSLCVVSDVNVFLFSGSKFLSVVCRRQIIHHQLSVIKRPVTRKVRKKKLCTINVESAQNAKKNCAQ